MDLSEKISFWKHSLGEYQSTKMWAKIETWVKCEWRWDTSLNQEERRKNKRGTELLFEEIFLVFLFTSIFLVFLFTSEYISST